jgi:hypothetical protein
VKFCEKKINIDPRFFKPATGKQAAMINSMAIVNLQTRVYTAKK